MLRAPQARAISHWKMHLRMRLEAATGSSLKQMVSAEVAACQQPAGVTSSIDAPLDANISARCGRTPYLGPGAMFRSRIAAWASVFGRGKVMALFQEELRAGWG